MKKIKLNNLDIFIDRLDKIDFKNKTVINTINAHSYIVAKNDIEFKKALVDSDVLLPDGEGIVLMIKSLKKERIKKIAGANLHHYLLNIAQQRGLKCFYLGSSQNTLDSIKANQEQAYSNIRFEFYSPPFKDKFSKEDNEEMIESINGFGPDILFVGMTAPKQEKWVYQNKEFINAKVICCIGAVFDFVAETKKRSPKWIIDIKLEWLYRSLTAWRLTKRYAYSTPLFLFEIIKLKLKKERG
jgi:N-acetylglucosaminyldiphosphoundecaprenol N-acetyl-beta-D-mannosaminyltransferase